MTMTLYKAGKILFVLFITVSLCFGQIKRKNLVRSNTEVVNIDSVLMTRLKEKIPAKNGAGNLKSYKIISVEFLKADFDIDDTAAVILPQSRYYDVYKNANCSNERRGWTEQLSLTKNVTLNRSASFNKVVQSSKSFSATIPFPKVGGSATGSVSKNVTLTNQTGWSETENVTSNVSRSINMEVSPKKVLFVKLQKTVNSVRVPFKAVVFVDAVIEAEYQFRVRGFGNKPSIRIRNQKRFLASDLLGIQDRNFALDGFISNSSADSLEVLYSERNVKPRTDCINNLPIGSEKGMKPSNRKNILLSRANEPDLNFGLTVEEFFGSVSVKTSDSVGQVFVRHLSFGPGLCEVETRSSLGKIITTLAPPAFWSEWQPIENHMGAITMNLNTTVKCDTGVRSQVKYWKD